MKAIEPGHDKPGVNEVSLKADGSHKSQTPVHPHRCAAQDAIKQQNGGDGEGNVEHTLYEEGKQSVLGLLKEYTGCQGHDKAEDDHPYGGSIQLLFLHDRFAQVDTDKEDGNAAPENLQMANGSVYGWHPQIISTGGQR